MRQAGCIQFDPVDVCGKNAELTLQSRVQGFTKQTLWQLLYRDRLLVDYPDKNLSILPTEDWPYFERYRRSAREGGRQFEGLAEMEERTRQYLRENGPVNSDTLPVEGQMYWHSMIHWSGQWHGQTGAARIVTAQGRYRWNRLRLSFLRAEDGSLGTVVGVLMDIDQEKRNASALQKKAEEDPLTGLLNKNFTHARIAAALENQPEGSLSALLILDMDNFKQVNDGLGHLGGDAILTNVSSVLRRMFRDAT